MVMALMFFLVAVMVSSVVIAVSNTATRKMTADRDQQQAYLTVTSVADYIQSEISKYQFSVTDIVSSNQDVQADSTTMEAIQCSCDFKPLMDRIANYMYAKNFSEKERIALNLKLEPVTKEVFKIHFSQDTRDKLNNNYFFEDGDIEDVKVTISVEENAENENTKQSLDICITIESCATGSGNSDSDVSDYVMTVYMKSNQTSSKKTTIELASDHNKNITEADQKWTSDLIIEETSSTYFWVTGIVEKGYGQNQ